jgi:hypothetical protein
VLEKLGIEIRSLTEEEEKLLQERMKTPSGKRSRVVHTLLVLGGATSTLAGLGLAGTGLITRRPDLINIGTELTGKGAGTLLLWGAVNTTIEVPDI